MAVKKKQKKVSAKAPKAKKKSAAKRAPARKAPARAAKAKKPAKKAARKPASSAKAAKSKPAARKAKAPAKRAAPAPKKSAAPARAKAKPAAPRPKPREARARDPEAAVRQANANAAADAQAAASGADEETAERMPPARIGRLPRALRHEADIDEPRATAGAPERAFIDPENPDDLAEELGEEYVKTVTSGEPSIAETRDEVLPEESGGPFIETSSNTEFAGGTDESNPLDAEQEPFPTANKTTRK